MDAALDLFARHGFDATSVRMIARAAGVRESALYHHFKDKASLLVDMVQLISQRRSENMAQLLADTVGQDLHSVLEHLVAQIARVMRSDKPRKFVQMMMLSGASEATTQVRGKLGEGGAEQLSEFFRALQKRKLVRKELDPRMVAHWFFMPLFTAFYSPFSPDQALFSEAALRRLLAQHVAILARGIGV